MDISDRIRQKMTEHNLKAVDLARMTGATKGSVSQWLNGISSPGGKYIVSLTKALRCDANWLFGGISSDQTYAHSSHVNSTQTATKLLPVINDDLAKKWNGYHDHPNLEKNTQWEHGPSTISDSAFWMAAVGDSMISPIGPCIGEGHLILVDPTAAAENGHLVVAQLDSTDELTFKKLVVDAGQTYLKPLNPNYHALAVYDNYRIIGVVVEAKILL